MATIPNYEGVNWENGESGGTPLGKRNLNKMDEAIKTNRNLIKKSVKIVGVADGGIIFEVED